MLEFLFSSRVIFIEEFNEFFVKHDLAFDFVDGCRALEELLESDLAIL